MELANKWTDNAIHLMILFVSMRKHIAIGTTLFFIRLQYINDSYYKKCIQKRDTSVSATIWLWILCCDLGFIFRNGIVALFKGHRYNTYKKRVTCGCSYHLNGLLRSMEKNSYDARGILIIHMKRIQNKKWLNHPWSNQVVPTVMLF